MNVIRRLYEEQPGGVPPLADANIVPVESVVLCSRSGAMYRNAPSPWARGAKLSEVPPFYARCDKPSPNSSLKMPAFPPYLKKNTQKRNVPTPRQYVLLLSVPVILSRKLLREEYDLHPLIRHPNLPEEEPGGGFLFL